MSDYITTLEKKQDINSDILYLMAFEELVRIVKRLRGPGGCPWDREQTRESLKPFLVEEFHELIDALESSDVEGMKEELGDLLFQIVIHCQLSKEEGLFDVNDVIRSISRKMVERHPHVFGGKELKTSADVHRHWVEQKEKLKKGRKSLLDRIPGSLPALARAQKLQEKASEVGFDWDNIGDVLKKLDEEIGEFKEALENKNHDEIEEEMGDLIFVMVRIANYVDVSSEDALKKSINKFTRRFQYLERQASVMGNKLSQMTLEEMDVLWNRAKEEDI
jgi:tetrapyrrole methylase family protein/MazG family protein